MSRSLSTDDILILLKDVAADVITPRFRQLQTDEVHEKSPGSLVTVADHEAERLITAALKQAYPDAVVLGEEAHEANPSLMNRYAAAPHAFTVDPVDGTRNFVHGSPDHAVMVAEVRGGETVRAWIWQPEHAVAWTAERGTGTWRNGERVIVEPRAGDELPAGASSMRRIRRQTYPGLAPLRLTWMCCGVDYPRLMEGSVDFIVYNHSWPWDHAPGGLMVTEAGGVIGDMVGDRYSPLSLRPGLIVASDRGTYEAAVRAISPHF